ncbi:MAG: DNA polymerase [Candidatus Pacebacteria bacterium]|nr:DNA polymerase [Candidatus Paceibacterota bacterium]
MKTLILIDANSLIHRCFHALPPLTNKKGEPTNALYGLSSVLIKIFREYKPDYAAAFFDRPEETNRKKDYAEYKAGRVKAPDELIEQIIKAKEVFRAFGIKTFELPGFEADDLIGTAAERFKGKEEKIIILTGDLDTTQLVSDQENVTVETFKKGITEMMVYDEKAVKERFGVEAWQVVDYKGLAGDSSDNIKGIPGVGPKTAVPLLNEFGTIEEIFKNIDEKDKRFKKFIGFEKEAIASKKLAIIERDAPIDLGKLENLKTNGLKEEDLKDLFLEMGFQSLIKRIEGEKSKKAENGGLFEKKENKVQLFNFNSKQSREKLEFIFEEEKLGEEKAKSKKIKVGFSLKKIIKEQGLEGPYFDLGIAFWLLDSNVGDYSSEYIFKRFLKKEWRNKEEDLFFAYKWVEGELKKNNLIKVFNQIEMPLLPILSEMENWGIEIKKEKLERLKEKVREEVNELAKKIYKLAGGEFNINSPKQMGEVLFKKLNIAAKKIKKTAGGAISTSYENLIKIKDEHKIIELILEYREQFKVLSTYIEPIIELTDKKGRLHTSYLQTGTATGRLSSEHPNLQNIPQGGELAQLLREVFSGGEGKELVSFDYSQMELRILASLSRDDKMIKAFKEGKDIHAATASYVFNVPFEEVDREKRRVAKVLNFGIVYGMGVNAFAESSGLKREEAKKFIEEYFKEFSEIKRWQENIKREARTLGYVTTLNGRRRLVPDLMSSSPRFAAQAERIVINMPTQGLAADVMKIAIIKTKEMLKKEGWWGKEIKMLLTIHDELLFEIEKELIEKAAKKIRKEMEEAFKLSVPLLVEIKKGKNWGEMKKMEV